MHQLHAIGCWILKIMQSPWCFIGTTHWCWDHGIMLCTFSRVADIKVNMAVSIAKDTPKKKSKSKMRANFQVPKLALNEGIYEHYSPNPTCDFFFDRGVTQLEAKSIWSKKCGRPPRNHRQPAFCLVSSSLFLISSSKRLSRQWLLRCSLSLLYPILLAFPSHFGCWGVAPSGTRNCVLK